MQRQSLGSPATKHHPNSPISDEDVDKSRRNSRSGVTDEITVENGHEKRMLEKKTFRTSTSASITERSIHLIPLLALLCFLVLYLFSHDPSPKDLSGFRGFEGRIDSEVAAVGRLAETEASDGISALKTNRRLKQQFGGGHRR